MSNDSTNIEILIQQVGKMADSVDKLVVIDAARMEREKHQEKENVKVAKFMNDNIEPLARLKRTHARYDKWGTSLGFVIIIAVLTALGFNFKQ